LVRIVLFNERRFNTFIGMFSAGDHNSYA